MRNKHNGNELNQDNKCEGKQKKRISLPCINQVICTPFVILFLLCIIGFYLRVNQLDNKSIWYDEAFSLSIVNQDSFSKVITVCKKTVHPPLYHFFLYPFYKNGIDFFWLRFLNVIFGVGTIVVSYFIGKELKNFWIGIFIAAGISLSPFAVHYSQELRMYSLLGFLTSLQILIAFKLIKNMRISYGIIFAIFSVATILTQYYAIFVTLGLFIFLLLNAYNKEKFNGIKKIFVIFLFFFIVFLPWFPTFIHHGKMNTLSGDMSAKSSLSLAFIRECYIEFFLGIIQIGPISFLTNNLSDFNRYEISLFFLLSAVVLILGLLKIQKESASQKSPHFLFLVLCLFFPIFLTLIHLLLNGRFYSRYLIVFLPIVFYWISEGICFFRNKIIQIIVIIIFILFFISSSLILSKIDLRDITLPAYKFLKNKIEKDTIIIHSNLWSFLPFKHYFKEDVMQFLIESDKIQNIDREIIKKDQIINNIESFKDKYIIFVVSEWNFERKSSIAEEFQKKFLNGRLSLGERDFSVGIKWIKIYQYRK